MCHNIFNFGFCSVKRKLRISPDEIFRLVLETKIFKSFPVLLYSLLKACTCNLEYLTSEGKIPRSLKEVSMRFRKKSVGKTCDKAREYQEKALAVRIEIGDRDGEARSYGNLATLFQLLGQYDRAREYQEK